MNILAITLHPSATFRGGSGRVAQSHISWLHAHGHSVPELSYDCNGAPLLASAPGHYVTIGRAGGFFKRSETARKLIRSSNSDVIASHYHPYMASSLIAGSETPTVIHFHGPWAEESFWSGMSPSKVALIERLERLTLRRASAIIALSEAFADIARHKLNGAAVPIYVVPGSIERMTVSPKSIKKTRRILVARRLVRRTGVLEFVQQLNRNLLSTHDVKVTIVGAGPIFGEVQSEILDRGLSESVELRGFVTEEELDDLYRSSLVSILPSVALEGFGMSALESLARGTPVVVTPIGGMAAFVRGLSPHLVAPSASPGQFVEHLFRTISTGQLPSSTECVEFAGGFNSDSALGSIVKIYEEVIAYSK